MTSSPSVPTRPIAIVAAHGELAAGLVSAVAQITGRGDLLAALSNRGLGPGEIEAAILALVDDGVLAVFTDLPAGSCTMAARRVQRERPAVSVATGVNLATLLDFVCTADARATGVARDGADDADLAARTHADLLRAVERGRGTLNAITPPTPAAPVHAAAPLGAARGA